MFGFAEGNQVRIRDKVTCAIVIKVNVFDDCYVKTDIGRRNVSKAMISSSNSQLVPNLNDFAIRT